MCFYDHLAGIFLKKQTEKYRGIISSTTVPIETWKPTGSQVQNMAINRRLITGRSMFVIFCYQCTKRQFCKTFSKSKYMMVYAMMIDRVYKEYSAKHEYLQ